MHRSNVASVTIHPHPRQNHRFPSRCGRRYGWLLRLRLSPRSMPACGDVRRCALMPRKRGCVAPMTRRPSAKGGISLGFWGLPRVRADRRSPRVPTPRAREINRGHKCPGVRLATLRRPPQNMPRSMVGKQVSVESQVRIHHS